MWSEVLPLLLLNDIRIRRVATINGLSRSTDPKWACAYHGHVAEGGSKQSEVEGTHVSVVLICRIVRS